MSNSQPPPNPCRTDMAALMFLPSTLCLRSDDSSAAHTVTLDLAKTANGGATPKAVPADEAGAPPPRVRGGVPVPLAG